MAITATFWTFAKRRNSTLTPGAAGTSFNISIKYPCTVEQPDIEIHSAEVWKYNYCYIPHWGRYYFVESHTCIAAGTYQLTLAVDVCGTYKTQIAPQSVFAEYSSALYNLHLRDPRNTTSEHFLNTSFESALGLTIGAVHDFCRVVTTNGRFNGTDVIEGQGTLNALLHALATPTDIAQLMQDINGANPFQNICEVWQSPFEMSECASGSQIGNTTILGKTIGGRILTDAEPTTHINTFILDQLQNIQWGDYRDRDMRASLQIPFVGAIDLDITLLQNSKWIDINYTVDILSGAINYVVYAVLADGSNSREFIHSCGAVLKKNVALYAQQSEMAQFTQSFLNFGAGVIDGGTSGGIVGAGIGAAGALVENFNSGVMPPRVNSSGSFSGTIAPFYTSPYFRKFILNIHKQSYAHDPNWITATHGRPCQSVITIASCGGYIKAREASVAIPGTEQEQAEINNILNGGMYYE